VFKADPYALWAETPPKTASVVWDLDYHWGDDAWMSRRADRDMWRAPVSIYEVHLGSWRRHGDGRSLSYREIAEPLADYAADMGFTHVELMPVMEHPFYGSWGYQVTGYFAPTSRYGTPQDLMYLIDALHRRGVGVILDWVPAHFPSDEYALSYFDGTHLYEHADPRRGLHPDWDSLIFNYGRKEVMAFLISSARFWIDRYHADGLRVDGVASMLYLDYSREHGQWIPNEDGSNENRDAVAMLRTLGDVIDARHPGVMMIAEESTSWPRVSHPARDGGLGFHFKWDMGWMHDTLRYMGRDPIHRTHHHHEITFRIMYAWSERFVLPLSHDEVVHAKGSLLDKMPGDRWQKLASLRLLLGYMFAQPGKKLLFMGAELAAEGDWNHDGVLNWGLLDRPDCAGVRAWVRDLNQLYRRVPAMHVGDARPDGFAWITCDDREQSVLALLRLGAPDQPPMCCVLNFTPVPRHDYRLGVPIGGRWREVLNSDAGSYGGSGQGNLGGVDATDQPCHGHPRSIVVNAPPLGCVFLAPEPYARDSDSSADGVGGVA
jgi:1,4-alpha-glucan branching enzyme